MVLSSPLEIRTLADQAFDERQRVVAKPLYDALEKKYGNGEARP